MDTLKNNDIEKQLDEIARLPSPKKRIWEIDFFRGLLILFVIFDHFMFDVMMLRSFYTSEAMIAFGKFAYEYRKSISDVGVLRKLTHDVFVYLFVLLSGISCSFSRNNLKRGLKMSAFAIGFSLTTLALTSLLQMQMTIWFNVIHVITLCVLIFSLVEFLLKLCKCDWQKNVFGGLMFSALVVMMVLGYYFAENPTQQLDWSFVFVKYYNWGSVSVDYWPLLPSLGWFLAGAFLGKFLYKEKTTLFPSVDAKWLYPLNFVGRHSIWFYFGSQVLIYGVLYLLAVVFGVL